MSAAASSAPSPTGIAVATQQLVKCKASASLLPGNLIAGSKYYGYIHRNELHLVECRHVGLGVERAESRRAEGLSEKESINQADFIKLGSIGDVIVVVTQGGGVFALDENGTKLLHSYKHNKSTSKELHLRGIASDGKDGLYVGTGTGDILVFQVTKSKMALTKTISHAQVASEGGNTSAGVSALVYAQPHSSLVSGDDYGNIVFWAGAGDALNPSKTVRIAGVGAPVNLLSFAHGWCVSATACGHIRMYDVAARSLAVEIAAHTRAINALDIHPTRPMLLAGSEDTFVSCWSLPSPPGDGSVQVRHLMSEVPSLGLLTGCRFGGAHHELILTTVYDSRSIAIMHTP